MLSVLVEEDKREQGTENEGQDGTKDNQNKTDIKTIRRAYDTSLGKLGHFELNMLFRIRNLYGT